MIYQADRPADLHGQNSATSQGARLTFCDGFGVHEDERQHDHQQSALLLLLLRQLNVVRRLQQVHHQQVPLVGHLMDSQSEHLQRNQALLENVASS